MWWRKILGLKPNDWKAVWYDRGSRTVSYISVFGDDDRYETKFCDYTIYYSKSRDRYKLKTRGHGSKDNAIYTKAMQALIRFQNSSD